MLLILGLFSLGRLEILKGNLAGRLLRQGVTAVRQDYNEFSQGCVSRKPEVAIFNLCKLQISER